METYAISALVPATIEVFENRQDFEKKTGQICPVYDPTKPNCYWRGDATGLNRLENGTLVDYGTQPYLNIPGPYTPIVPVDGKTITINGKALVSPWHITTRKIAEEVAAAVDYPVLTSKDAPFHDVKGAPEGVDAFFIKVLNLYWVNLGEAYATKAPYGEGSPGKWVLDEDHIRLYWEPDTRVNSVTMPPPLRNLQPDERIQSVGFGGYIVVKGEPEAPGNSEVLKRLDRIEYLLSQLLLKP